MPIYQLDPNAANRQQLQFFMSHIALFAMQRAQQKAAMDELKARTEAAEKLASIELESQGLARPTKGPTTKTVEMAGVGQTGPAGTEGNLVRVREPAEKPDVTLAGRQLKYTPKGYEQQLFEVPKYGTFFLQRDNQGKVTLQQFKEQEEPTEKVTWSKPYKDESTGAILQKSSTGQIRAIIGRAPVPKSGAPKGRTAEANWWAGQLSVDLKTEKGRAAVKRVMDTLYGRGDTERKMFLDAFRAARDPLLDPQENIAAAQELYNKLQTSDKNREKILEQFPDAKYDFANGYWYVIRNGIPQKIVEEEE